MTTGMMVTRRDLNLNSSPQACDGSIMEELRQAMLRHELVFRDQVRELHRLYWTQKHLMHEILWKDSHIYTPHFLQNPLMANFGLTQGTDVCREQISGSYELGKRPQRAFDLRFPADGFILHSGEEQINDAGLNSAWMNAHNVIDLEKPAMLEVGEGADVACSSDPKAAGSLKLTVRSDVNANETFRDNSGHVCPENNANADDSAACGEQKLHSANAGSNTCSGTRYISEERQKNTSCKRMQIDLNMAQDDESLHVLPDTAPQTFPSTRSSIVPNAKLSNDSSKSCPKECESGNKSKESCITVQPNISSPPSESSRQIVPKIREDVPGIIGKKLPRSNMDAQVACHGNLLKRFSGANEGIHSLSNSCKEGEGPADLRASVGSTNSPPTMVADSGEKQACNDGSEEDTLSSHVVAKSTTNLNEPFEEYPVGNQPDQMTGSNDQLDCPAIKQKSVPESCHHLSSEFSSNKTSIQKTQDHDLVITVAAETLIGIFSENRLCFVDSLASNVDVLSDSGRDEPQYSADSFEKATLNLEEITDDGLLLPVMPTEMENKEDVSGVKLRRGRRLQDFQKEILPGLVSLARHEICDDLHAIGHELQKNSRPERTCGAKWRPPTRSRLPRRCSSWRGC